MTRIEYHVTPRLLEDSVRVLVDSTLREVGAEASDDGPDVLVLDSDAKAPDDAQVVIYLPSEAGDPGRLVVNGVEQDVRIEHAEDIRRALIVGLGE